jgi:hypothetical protein
MTSQSDRDRARRRRTTGSGGTTGGAGQVSAQFGGDGVEPAIGIGGGLTVDSSGDVGLRVAPGVSVDLTPSAPAETYSAPDTTSY